MELSIKPAKGDYGIEAGSEISVFAWSKDVIDGTQVEWTLRANPASYEISETSCFSKGATSMSARAPESTEEPLTVIAKVVGGVNYETTLPVLSAHPTQFSIERESGFEFEGSPGCMRVTLGICDQFGNSVSDGTLVDVSLCGAGKLLRVDRRDERTSPTLKGESVFYLDEEALLSHERYVPTVTILVEGPELRELNLRTWELGPHEPGHVVIE